MRYETLGLCMLTMVVSASAHAVLKCGGTEPFWNLAIESKKAIYENMDGSKVIFNNVALQDAQGVKPGHVRKYLFKSAKSSADAVVLQKDCSDGMSDETYPYDITLTISKSVLTGCCR